MIDTLKFEDMKSVLNGAEGIVLLGAGGDLSKWTEGITTMLIDEGIVTDELWYRSAHVLNTTGGRTDLLLVIDAPRVDCGMLALWRIKFGDCSWASDYIVNYVDQHTVEF